MSWFNNIKESLISITYGDNVLQDVNDMKTPRQAYLALKNAVNTNNEIKGINTLDVISKLIEQWKKDDIVDDDNRIKGSYIKVSDSLIMNLSNLGACSYIDQLFGSRLSSIRNCESSLKLISLMIQNNDNNRTKFYNNNACYHIIKSAQLHKSNKNLLILSLQCLRYMSLGDNNIGIKLLSSGICPLIISTIYVNDKIENDDSNNNLLFELCCRIIYSLTHDLKESSIEFENVGGCEVIINYLNSNIKLLSHQSFHWALRAIGGLSRKNLSNKIKLAELGVCELIINILQNIFNDNNITDEISLLYTEGGCYAIGHLCYPNESNQNRFCNLDTCNIITNMLKKHGNEKECIQECFRAIRNLCHCNKEIVEIFTELSVCELILDLIFKYRNNNELCQWGWYVVSSLAIITDTIKILGIGLALDEENKPSNVLKSICGCELVVETMINYKQICSVVQWSSMALGRLASDESNRILLGAVHSNIIYEILNQSLILHLDDEDVIEEVCFAISNLVLNTNNAICMNSVGVSINLLNVLKLYKHNEVVCENALIAISNMCLLNDSNIYKSFVESGICSRLPSTLARLGENAIIASYIYIILYSLSITDEYRVKLSSGNFIITLIKSMTLHMKNIDILINIIRIISKLCLTEVAIQKLQLTNICQVLINLLMIFRNKENINSSKKYLYLLELCLLLISDLSMNSDICRGNFLQYGGVELLILMINLYIENKIVVVNGCTAIINLSCGSDLSPTFLSNTYPSKQDKLSNVNLDTYNNSYLNNNISISSITNYASSTLITKISSKDLSKEICDHFSTLKISQLINNILKLHYNEEDVSISICQVIHSLSSNSNIRVRFGQTGINEAIMNCIPHHLDHTGFVLIACNCIGSLSFHDDVDDYNHSNDITLGSLGACQLITQLLDKFTESSTISLACCRAIAHLSIRSDLNKKYFNDLQTIESILACIKCHNNNISIIIHSFLAIGLLGFNNKENCAKLINNNVHLLILEYTTIYLYNNVVIESLFRCIYSLIIILNDEFVEIGLIDIVSTMLANHSYNIITSEWICKVINILAIINYSNRIHLIDKGVSGGIIALLNTYVGNESMFSSLMKYTTSLDISIVICNTIFNLLIDDDGDDFSKDFIVHSNTNSNAYSNIHCKGTKGKIILSHQKHFLNTNVIDLVVKIYYKFSNSLLIGQACCRALFVLCVDNRKICNMLGNLGVCQLVGETLHQFPSNEQVAIWASRCVYELVYKNSSNTYKMISNLICEIIPVVIQTHQTSAMVCQIGCSIISTLTISIQDLTKKVTIDGNNSNIEYLELTSRFGQSGGCEAVLFALENHCNISVLNAFSNLSLVKGNSTYFGATDACTSLINCYKLYNNNEFFCSAILEAIGNICIDTNNKEKILQIFNIENIIQSKELHKDNKDVVKWANYAISRLETKIKKKLVENISNIHLELPPTSSPIIKISKKFLPKHNNIEVNEKINNNDGDKEINNDLQNNIIVSMKYEEKLIVDDNNNPSSIEIKEVIEEKKDNDDEHKQIDNIKQNIIDKIIDINKNIIDENQEIIEEIDIIPEGNNQKDIHCQLTNEEQEKVDDNLELKLFINETIDEIGDNNNITTANLSNNKHNSNDIDEIDDFLKSIE